MYSSRKNDKIRKKSFVHREYAAEQEERAFILNNFYQNDNHA